jgi:hypothetical protein
MSSERFLRFALSALRRFARKFKWAHDARVVTEPCYGLGYVQYSGWAHREQQQHVPLTRLARETSSRHSSKALLSSSTVDGFVNSRGIATITCSFDGRSAGRDQKYKYNVSDPISGPSLHCFTCPWEAVQYAPGSDWQAAICKHFHRPQVT